MNFKKMSTKVLAVLMSLFMMVSFCAPAVSAALADHEHGDLNYVSIGDSMTNGYGFDFYNQDTVYGDISNAQYGANSYANQFAAWLGSQGFEVNHTRLALSGMTSYDLLYLLDKTKEPTYDDWNGFLDYIGEGTDFGDTMSSGKDVSEAEVFESAQVQSVRKYFQESVRNAHIISLCVGNAEFGAYLMAQITDIMAGEYDSDKPEHEELLTLEEVLATVESEKIKEFVRDLYAELEEVALEAVSTVFKGERAKIALDYVAGLVAGYLVNYEAILETIVELNPNADIVIVGLVDTMQGFNVEGVDVSGYASIFFDSINAYTAAVAASKEATNVKYANVDFFYAEQPEVEYIYEKFPELVEKNWKDKTIEGLSSQLVRERTIEAFYDTFGMVIDLETLKTTKFEELDLDSVIYLAVEAAVAKSASVEKITLANLTQFTNEKYMSGIQTEMTIGMIKNFVIAGTFEAIKNMYDFDEAFFKYYLALEEDAKIATFKDDIYSAAEDAASSYDIELSETVKVEIVKEFIAKFDTYAEKYLLKAEADSAFDQISEINPIYDTLKQYADEANTALVKASEAITVPATNQGVFDYLVGYFTGSDDMLGLCKLFLMCAVGDGLSTHPTPAHHDNLFVNVKNAYEGGHTAFDETFDNFEIAGKYFFENYEEIYETIYNEALEAGKIDELVSYLEDAKEYIVFAKDFVLGYEEYFRGDDVKPQIETLTENALTTIEAAIKLVREADVLDAKTYAEFMNLVNALEVNLADIATLVMIVAEDAYIYAEEFAQEYIIPVVIEQLLALNAQLLEALEALDAANTEIKNIVTAVEEAVKAFFANNGFKADYTVSADSFFLAIGDDTLYSETLAAMLGLNDKQFGTMGWNENDSSIIAKADLITIGYTDAMINHFAIDQLIGFIKSYISVDLKADADAYIEEALGYFFSNMEPTPNKAVTDVIIASVKDVFAAEIDTIAGTIDLFTDAEKTELDWASLVGEENAKAIAGIVDAVVAEVLATEIADLLVADIDVYDLFIKNMDQMDPTVAGFLGFFKDEDIKDMFGDYANYSLKLPVVEAVAFAVESYIYNYVKFNVEYAQTVYAISALNPNAQIVLLGGYNAFDGIGLEVTIGEIVVDLGEILTAEVKAEIDNAFDFAYGELDNAVDAIVTVENIAIALDVIDAFLAGLEEAMAFDPTVDFVDAVKDFEITPEDVVAIVGEENAALANKILYITKFILVEANVFENVVDAIPTVEDFLPAVSAFETMIQNGLIDLDAIADGYMADLGVAADELAAIVADLAIYAEQFKNGVQGLEAVIDGIFEALHNSDLVFDETVIDLGAIFGDVIPGTTSIHSIMLAHTFKNVIYVDIADAETIYDTIATGEVLDFLLNYVIDGTVTDLSEAGHAYVAAQIYNALTITCDHYDADMDHYCDNLVCDEKLSECVDADKDHKCDFVGCGATLSVCADNDKDHKCDYCGAELTKCADADKDHKCDLCGAELTKCADENKDHKCDVCGKELTKCADENKDHKCDLCGAELTKCADENKDHNCDLCGAKISDCADANNDHNCDLCGKKISECADNNNDHNCDICGAKLTDCVDNDKDGKCDICGIKLGLSRTAIIIIISASVVVAAGLGVGIFFGIKTGFFAKLFKKN